MPPPATTGSILARSETGTAEPSRATTFPTAVIQVYRALCLQCHDSDGTGQVVRDALPKVPDFTEPKWQAGRSDTQLSRSILEGKGKSMPRMKDKLGSVDVQQLVAFVRGFRGGGQVVDDEPEEPSAPGPLAVAVQPAGSVPRATAPAPPSSKELSIREGGRFFPKFCARCHGADGRGSAVRDSLPAIPDFTARAWQETRTDPQLVVSILEGKGAEMPAFQDKLAREHGSRPGGLPPRVRPRDDATGWSRVGRFRGPFPTTHGGVPGPPATKRVPLSAVVPTQVQRSRATTFHRLLSDGAPALTRLEGKETRGIP